MSYLNFNKHYKLRYFDQISTHFDHTWIKIWIERGSIWNKIWIDIRSTLGIEMSIEI